MITPAYGLTATERVLPRLALDWTTGLAQTGVDVTRAGVATFVGSNGLIQSATADTQRIDYSTGVAGLLVEESRTNLFTYSEELHRTAIWLGLRLSRTTNAGEAPDGNATAEGINQASGQTDAGFLYQSGSVTSQAYVGSIYAKPNGKNFLVIGENYIDTSVNETWFDLANGTVGTTDAGHTPLITNVGNGWYRCSIGFTPNASRNGRVQFKIADTDGSTTVVDSGGLLMWGAQLEAGAFPTSYIPTEATTVTRNADVATMTGTDFTDWFNSAEGTFFIETNARNGDDLLTAGSYVLTADATALKKYATTYTADPSATQLDFGKGTIQRMMYYPHDLIAAELAALTA